MSKTQLTPTQRQVFDQIVKLTNGGKKVYEGRVSLPGVPGSTSNHYVVLFSMLGLLKMERRPGKPRRITLLVGPEGVETTSVSAIMVARMSGRSLKEDKSPPRRREVQRGIRRCLQGQALSLDEDEGRRTVQGPVPAGREGTVRDFIWIRSATPEELIKRACEKVGCKRDTMLGQSRRRRIAWPRQDLMLALYEIGLSYPEIGKLMGRHHTTVMDGAERAKARREGRYAPRPVRPKAPPLRTKLPGPAPKKREPRNKPIDPHIAFLAAIQRAHGSGGRV